MKKNKNFFTIADEMEIIKAIKEAELDTSGEIRVHIEQTSNLAPMDRAKEVFYQLDMHQTKQKNGVLFYFCIDPKGFAILGDSGIDSLVLPGFWDNTRDMIFSFFKNKKYKDGLVSGILDAGKQLKKYFPYDAKSDINELSDEISKG